MSQTADPKAARAHARAQGGTIVPNMPTLPASAATDIPDGVPAADMLWAETVFAGGYAARRLNRGARLRLIDVAGDACVSIQIFNAEAPFERLNVADTLKVQWNAYLGEGRMLLSDQGRCLMSMISDTASTHDAFCGPSNLASNARKYGAGDNHTDTPNARDRLALAAAKFGLQRRDLHPGINLFKGVKIALDGTVTPDLGPFGPGRAVTLRADMDVIVLLANCPHVLDPRPDFTATALRILAWRGAVAAADDPIRTATPEAIRAFLNVDDYYTR